MPYQNRVDPFGQLIRTADKGCMMGNRGGVLHNADRQIVRQYASRRWITCVLQFRERPPRVIMSPNLYTELFFLDEAVAFSAGHRPCAECRRDRFNAFRGAWQLAHDLARPPLADEMDLVLHPARIAAGRKVICDAPLSSLPDRTFVRLDENAYLLLGDSLVRWTSAGYTDRIKVPKESIVTVLTPKPFVMCFQHGYAPEIHHTANSNSLDRA